MSRASREKGRKAELEVAAVLRTHGFDARRDGRLDDDLSHDLDGVHLEVKRAERLELPAWLRQAEDDAGERRPVVVYRSSRQPWRAVVTLDHYLELEKRARTTKEVNA